MPRILPSLPDEPHVLVIETELVGGLELWTDERDDAGNVVQVEWKLRAHLGGESEEVDAVVRLARGWYRVGRLTGGEPLRTVKLVPKGQP